MCGDVRKRNLTCDLIKMDIKVVLYTKYIQNISFRKNLRLYKSVARIPECSVNRKHISGSFYRNDI